MELIAVVSIVAILTAIALPSYNHFICESQRSAAQSQMLKLAGDLERWRGKNLSYLGFIPENGYETTANISILVPKGSTSSNYAYRITLVDISCRTKTLNPTAVVAGCPGQGWVMIARPNSGDSTDTAASKGTLAAASRLVLDSQGVRCMTPGTLADHITDASIATATTSDAALCGTNSMGWK